MYIHHIIKTSLLLTFFLFLSSCGAITNDLFGNYPDSRYFYERFPQNKKAVIIVKNYSKKRLPKPVTWCKFDSNKCIRINFANLNKMLMVEPGTYILSSGRSKNVDNEEFISKKLRKVRNSVSFKANEGRINYVGAYRFEGTHREIDNEFYIIMNALRKKDYKFLQENFDNLDHEIEWLVKNYHKSPIVLNKRLAKVDFASNTQLTKNVEKFIEKVSKNKNDLKTLSKIVTLMDKMIKIEKERRKKPKKSKKNRK